MNQGRRLTAEPLLHISRTPCVFTQVNCGTGAPSEKASEVEQTREPDILEADWNAFQRAENYQP